MFEGTTDNKEAIALAIRQTKRWIKAAQQDKDPFIAALHISYAAGNIDLMRQLWSDQQIQEATKENITSLWKQVTRLQDEIQERVNKVCGGVN